MTTKPKTGKYPRLPVDEIEASACVQVRVRIDPRYVEEYAEFVRSGKDLPPVIVFAEKGSERYLLSDGFHRLGGYKLAGREDIPYILHEGGVREALAYALGANDTHGLRRNVKDRRNAVMIALKDPVWSAWNNTKIAFLCKVSDKLVARVREDLVLAGEIEDRDTVIAERDGKAVERKASRASGTKLGSSSGKSDERVSRKKSSTPPLTDTQKKVADQVRASHQRKPGPKSQDVIQREKFFQAIDEAVLPIPHDGAEAVKRWKCENKLQQLLYLRDFVNEMIDAIKAKKNAA